jgi:hypothetical protein
MIPLSLPPENLVQNILQTALDGSCSRACVCRGGWEDINPCFYSVTVEISLSILPQQYGVPAFQVTYTNKALILEKINTLHKTYPSLTYLDQKRKQPLSLPKLAGFHFNLLQ